MWDWRRRSLFSWKTGQDSKQAAAGLNSSKISFLEKTLTPGFLPGRFSFACICYTAGFLLHNPGKSKTKNTGADIDKSILRK
jgi:hypothetical protein